MKICYTIIACLLSGTIFAQQITVNVVGKDSSRISVSNVVQADDSLHVYNVSLNRVKKYVAPPPTTDSVIKQISISTKSGTTLPLSHTVTVPAGAFIVVLTGYEGSGKNCTMGGTLNWTKTGDAQLSNSGDAEVFTSSVATAGTYTITTTFGTGWQSSVVLVYTGVSGIGAKVIATGQSAPSVNITTTKTNSLLLGITSDFNALNGSSAVYRDAAKAIVAPLRGAGTNYYYSKTAATVKQYTEGISSPTGQASGTIFIELVAKSGITPPPPAPDTQPPTAPVLNFTSTTSSSVALTWSASTDNVGVTGYNVFTNSAQKATTTNTNFNVTGLSPSTIYSFFVQAKDAAGNTTNSNVITAMTSAPPPVDTTTTVKAEGFGANATGGANSGTIYHVTNLSGSGGGSLANGIGSNRTIVFDVSGTITARLDLIGISYLTIDGSGQTIILNGNNNGDVVSFDGSTTHHCILRNIAVTNGGNDGINVLDGAHDILITNCFSYGNRDGNIDIAGGTDVTVQYSILGGGNTGWSGDMLITGTNVSVHHNLFSPATSGEVGERCPLVHCNYSPVGNPNADIRNNLIWKFGRSGGTGSGYGTAIAYNATANVINNYYYTTGTSAASPTNTDDGYGAGATGKAYIAGNVSGNIGVDANAPNNHAAYAVPNVTTQNACDAARLILQKAGTNKKGTEEKNIINAVTLPGCP